MLLWGSMLLWGCSAPGTAVHHDDGRGGTDTDQKNVPVIIWGVQGTGSCRQLPAWQETARSAAKSQYSTLLPTVQETYAFGKRDTSQPASIVFRADTMH